MKTVKSIKKSDSKMIGIINAFIYSCALIMFIWLSVNVEDDIKSFILFLVSILFAMLLLWEIAICIKEYMIYTLIVYIALTISSGYLVIHIITPDVVYKKNKMKSVPVPEMIRLKRVSVWNNTEEQTDSSPNITAWNEVIPLGNDFPNNWLAVSRDLLTGNGGFLNHNDTVFIYGEEDKFRGEFVIKCKMNKKWIRAVDVLHKTDSLGLESNVLLIKINI